jgi:ABC-type transporter Mla maintaining outer membrane lipid asymmetry permease subunit MlaE
VGFAKVTIFGMLMATVSLYFGFEARDHMAEVAQNTSRAAIWSLVLVGFLDIIITTAYYL